ncbi:hypothetical protein M1247_33915 [Mycobacterium sp. 21AC1]|uniref:hypothetical protein n=1 Tax=[Mycobacterium] appelbergii TaxID=2939269 RepID=UPI002938E9F0|nr:hypothetical protein [Mycobacterium sp. 21AC1]MDV3129942.1 hypothetical protein [Mycobacterium sp. 21AC1]
MSLNLEAVLQRAGDPAEMLRNGPICYPSFAFPEQFTNWRDEQRAWKETVTLFDQSHHMWDTTFRGPDTYKLLSDTGINSFARFGKGKAKQFVAVNPDGYVIADAILFAHGDDRASLVGTPCAANWVRFQAEQGKYDVEISEDPSAPMGEGTRRFFRYQLNGPLTQKVLEKAVNGPLDRIKFFNIGSFEIAGCRVHALNHTMAGVPGQEMTGLELWGPVEDAGRVLGALLTAGEEFGMRQGGAAAYPSTCLESGWIALPVPAIYSGDVMKPYREWLAAPGFETLATIGGSYVPDSIDGYYVTPWDLGYGHLIKFDHDFIGRSALERMADLPHKRKVWLSFNDKDIAAVISSNLRGDEERAQWMSFPNSNYSVFQYDAVYDDTRPVGFANWIGYTVNIGKPSGIGMVDEADAVDGKELTLIWGEPNGGTTKSYVDQGHVQKEIRCTVSTTPLGQ